MLAPVDGWTLAHGLAGFFSGKIKITRLFIYPLPFLWEIYQLFFHYHPQGEGLDYVWVNSAVDVLIFLGLYEITGRFNWKHHRTELYHSMPDDVKGIIAYVLITPVTAWLFWDDLLRLKLGTMMPVAQLPLLCGALSPVMASFIVKRWINQERPARSALSWIARKPGFYYWIFGILPSAAVYLVLLSLTTFWHLVPW